MTFGFSYTNEKNELQYLINHNFLLLSNIEIPSVPVERALLENSLI